MPGEDWSKFESVLTEALQTFWGQLQGMPELLPILAFGIYASEDSGTIEPFAHNEASLRAVAEEWSDGTSAITAEKLPDFVVAPPDFEWMGEYQPLFEPVQEALDVIPLSYEDSAFEIWHDHYEAACLRVLKKLDQEGLFGTGADRAKICLFLHPGDFPSEAQVHALIPELNPGTPWAERFAPPKITEGQIQAIGPSHRMVRYESIVLSPKADQLALHSWDGICEVWKLGAWEEPAHRIWFENGLTAATYSSGGSQLYLAWRKSLGGPDREAGVLELNLGNEQSQPDSIKVTDEVWAMATSPSSGLVAISSADGAIQIFQEGGNLVQELTLQGEPRAMQFSEDGTSLWSADRTGGVTRFDTSTWKPAANFPASAESLALSPKTNQIAFATRDETKLDVIRILDASSLKQLKEIQILPRSPDFDPQYLPLFCGVQCLDISKDGTKLVAGVGFGEGNAEALVIAMDSGEDLFRFNEGHDSINGVQFTADDQAVLVTGTHFRGPPLFLWTLPEE